MLGILRDAKIKIVVAFEKCNQSLLKVLDQTYLQHYISCSVGDCMPYFKGMVINFTARYIKRLIPSYDGSSLKFRCFISMIVFVKVRSICLPSKL